MTPAIATCAAPALAESTTPCAPAAIALRWPGAVPAVLPDGRVYWAVLPSDDALLAAARGLALLAPFQK